MLQQLKSNLFKLNSLFDTDSSAYPQFITFLGTAFSLGLTLVAGVIFARILGPDGRGELTAIVNWASLFAIFGHLGIPNANVFYIGKNPESAAPFVRVTMVLVFVMSILLLPVGYYFSPYMLSAQRPEIIQASRLFLLYFPAQMFVLIAYTSFQGLKHHILWNVIRATYPLVMFLSACILIALKFVFEVEVDVILLTRIILNLLILGTLIDVFIVFILIRPFRGIKNKSLPIPLASLFKHGVTIVTTSGPRILNLRLDQIIIAAYLAPELLGYYAVAASWSYMALNVVLSIGQGSIAYLASIDNKKQQFDEIVSIYHRSFFLNIVLLTASLLLTPIAIPLLFGQEFNQSINLSFILIPAAFFSVLNGISADIFQGIGKPKYALIAEIVGLMISVPGIYLILPYFGIAGAAWLSIGVYITIHIIEVLIISSIFKSSPVLLYPSPWQLFAVGQKLMSLFKQRGKLEA